MQKLNRFHLIFSTLMILMITTSAGASFTVDGKGFYGNDSFVKAPTLGDQKSVPEGLSKAAWEKISASIERDRYRLNKDDRTGMYQAVNHTNDLHAAFTRKGVEVSPCNGKNGWNFSLHLSRYGYGSNIHAVPVTEKMVTKDNRIEYHRGDLVEWYINERRGIEQGFTLNSRPSGRTGTDPLQLQMTSATILIPEVGKKGKGIIFRDAKGKEVMRYSGLFAFDATGKDLGAKMAVANKTIRLIVDDHEAVYPITIDPFIETKKLLASDGADGDDFGFSVSISGDTAVVGARYNDDNGDSTGSAYIFSRNHGGADNWGEVKKLIAGNGDAYDYFGGSVSISGDTAIVGAAGARGDVLHSGSAYIFSRDEGGADNWGEVKKLVASDGAIGDVFGYSVSIIVDKAIVGAYWDDDNGDNSGSAYIFSRNQGGTDNWGEVKKLIAGDGAADDYFGRSVSISADTAVVGAYGDDDNGEFSGSAYIFSRDQGGADNWGEVKKLTASDGALFDDFGRNVSISADTAIVGAHKDDDNGYDSGSAYIFSRNHGGTDNWGEVKKLIASDGAANNYFGRSISISEDTVIVGSDFEDDNGDYTGSAYIFSRNQGGADNWGEVKKLIASDGAADDYFGFSVSISADTAIVGARQDDDSGDNSGSAYIFLASIIGTELAADFGVNGLWHHNGATWTQINAQNPEGMQAWIGGLATDFASSGLWNYTGSSWDLLTALNPQGMQTWTNGLAADFGTSGLWNYTGSTWDLLTTNDPEDMEAWTSRMAVDFGAFGLWNYTGSAWDFLTTSDAEGMTAWSGGLAVDFGAFGLWNYYGSSWEFLTTSDAEGMTAWFNGLAVDFGTFGLWNYNGASWDLLTTSNAELMASWSSGLAVDFGGFGLWNYTGSSWDLLTTSDAQDVEGCITSLVVDLGASGLWNYDGAAWTNLTGWDAEDMTAVDLN